MPYIDLHKLFVDETNRVNPEEIRMIEPMADAKGSIVTFKNNDVMRYKETPQEIVLKEWRMHHLWPNLERIIMAILGGVVGALVALFFKSSQH